MTAVVRVGIEPTELPRDSAASLLIQNQSDRCLVRLCVAASAPSRDDDGPILNFLEWGRQSALSGGDKAINGQDYSHNASPAEEAALNAVWSARMAEKPEDERLDTPAEYLQWAIEHSYTEGQDVVATMAGALASWAGNPVEPSPDVPLSDEQLKTALVAYAMDKRWRVETGGVTVIGVRVPTDDRAKLLLLGAAQSMADGSSAPLIVAGVNHGTLTKAQLPKKSAPRFDQVREDVRASQLQGAV